MVPSCCLSGSHVTRGQLLQAACLGCLALHTPYQLVVQMSACRAQKQRLSLGDSVTCAMAASLPLSSVPKGFWVSRAGPYLLLNTLGLL